jgi:3-phenylpropionate/trans-cinnamate dioxygenase ferredoxin subunit
MTQSKRLFAGKISDIPKGDCKRIDHDPPIAVFHVDGEFYATSDWCTHERASLSEGWVHDDCTIECPWHAAKFCLRTGKALSAPASVALTTYRVEVLGDEVFVLVPTLG